MEFKKIQSSLTMTAIIIITLGFFWMVYPYLYAIFWAIIIAALFFPVYRTLTGVIKFKRWAAFLTVLAVVILILLPLSVALGLIVKQAIDLYHNLTNPKTIHSLQSSIAVLLSHPTVQQILGDARVKEWFEGLSPNTARVGVQWLKAGSQSTIAAIIQIFIMLYALYYFFIDGEKWLKHLMHLLPFGDKNEQFLYGKFVSTAKATLKGTILIGMIQGTIGGVLFYIVGIPSAALWGLIMIIFSIIPAVSAFMVMVPAALYLLFTGQIWQAIVIIIGNVVVSLIDNFLRPVLVGKDIEMHPLIILFATIGGIGLFGITGVVIGPIIASLLLAVLSMYEQKFKHELDSSKT